MLAIAGLTAAMAGGVKAAKDYETSMVELAKVTDPDTAGTVGAAIREMAKDMPLAHEALMGIAADAGRLGVEGVDNILNFTKTVAQISVATDIMAEDAGTDFAKLLTLLGEDISIVDELGSAINELSNNMAVSSSEIVDSMLRSSASLAGLDMGTDEIVALNAAMNEVVFSARLAGTALKTIAEALQNPEKMVELANALGITVDEFRALRQEDPVELFKQLAMMMDEGGVKAEELVGILGDSASKLQALATNWDGVEEAIRMSNEQMEHATSLQTEYNIASDTFASRVQILRNNLHDVSIDVGNELIPTLDEFIVWIKGNTEEIGEFFTGIAEGIAASFKWLIDNKEGVGVALASIAAGLAVIAAIQFAKDFNVLKASLLGLAGATGAIGMVVQAFHDMKETAAEARADLIALTKSAKEFNDRIEESGRLAGLTATQLGRLREEAQGLIRDPVNEKAFILTDNRRDEFTEMGVLLQNLEDAISATGVEAGVVDRSFTDLESAMMVAFQAMQDVPGTGLAVFKDEAIDVLEALSVIEPALKPVLGLLNDFDVPVPDVSGSTSSAWSTFFDGLREQMKGFKDFTKATWDETRTIIGDAVGSIFHDTVSTWWAQASQHREVMNTIRDDTKASLLEEERLRDDALADINANLANELMTQEAYNVEKQNILDKYVAAREEILQKEKDLLDDEKKAHEEQKQTLWEILKESVRNVLTALKEELLLKSAAALAEAIAMTLGLNPMAVPKYAEAGAYALGAGGLAIAGFEKGALFNRPTLLPPHVVAESGVSEAYLPLSEGVFSKIGQGIVNALAPQPLPALAGGVQIDMRGMYDGAQISVRSDNDIKELARQNYELFKSTLNGRGL